MSDPCDWTSRCTNPVETNIIYPISDGPDSRAHKIRTNYSAMISGISISLLKTIRDYSVTYSTTYDPPTGEVIAYMFNNELLFKRCGTQPGGKPSLTVTDNCVIEKSILHYLDQRYGVCLYKYQKDELHLSINSTELAAFMAPGGNFISHMGQIKTNNYSAKTTVEWHLIIEGIDTVLMSSEYNIEPFGPDKGDGVRQILVFPQPPSLATPLTPEIIEYGFYDYGNLPGGESELNKLDGGFKDMYYPEWCRSLQEDTFWRQAADRRYKINWYHYPYINSNTYQPSPPFTEPYPIGSLAKDNKGNIFYSFNIADSTFNFLTDGDLMKLLPLTYSGKLYPISLS